jgi:probable phosphoglycerate mutase
MSHLMNCSPMVLWHGLAMAPTSVTVINSEERRPGIAIFRAAAVGDISHLSARGLLPSFSARFCEIYGNGERQD